MLPIRLLSVALSALILHPLAAQPSQAQRPEAPAKTDEVAELRKMVVALEERVSALERQNAALSAPRAAEGPSGPQAAAALVRASLDLKRDMPPPPRSSPDGAGEASIASQEAAALQPAPKPASTLPGILPGVLPGGATLNYYFDGYYEGNFNQPPGRVNDLRAYDVLSNVFSINQADLIFDLDPDLSARRRYGVRLDLQFGQATETLQGNPNNEPRPEVYRNIFQVYGTYDFPLGHGLDVDFGKWASSIGVEGNYVKDQMNYSRAYSFYFLPFYHTGARTSYKANDRITLNHWIVNGTNQSEPTNGFKDELFGYVLTPAKPLTWTFNYYLGQEHPDSVASTNCNIPVQPGLCVNPIANAPNGKLHIFDSYATWQATHKLTLQGEMDYVIQREWVNAAPGESPAATHVMGGVGYLQYALSPRAWLAARGEYFSDRGGMFSGVTQALKEGTATYEYKVADGLDAFLEYRRDWSNRPYFRTSDVARPSTNQDTVGVGLVWWYGGKQGVW